MDVVEVLDCLCFQDTLLRWFSNLFHNGVSYDVLVFIMGSYFIIRRLVIIVVKYLLYVLGGVGSNAIRVQQKCFWMKNMAQSHWSSGFNLWPFLVNSLHNKVTRLHLITPLHLSYWTYICIKGNSIFKEVGVLFMKQLSHVLRCYKLLT